MNEEALGVSEKCTSAELDVMIKLQKLSALSVTEGNLQIILDEIIDAAIAVTGADFGNIQLMDPVSSALRIAAQRGFPQWWLDFWNNVPKGQGSCGVSLESEERVIVEDVERSPIFAGTVLEIQRRAGVRAVQSTPLVSRSGKRIGMLSTHYKKPWRPDERTLLSLDLIARQAADCVEHVQVIARLHESEERFRTMDGMGTITRDISDARRIAGEREQLLACEQLARRQAEAANEQLRESEEKYRALFDSIDEGFCVVEVLFDDMDKPLDYRFLEVNRVFEKQTGISNAVGRRMREIAPAHEEHWFQIYGQIARTGESRRFESPALALGRFYDVYAFRVGKPGQRQVAILFNDITKRKQTEEALHRTQAFNQAVLGSLAANIAVIDREGNIIAVNEAWKRFAQENGGTPVPAPVGANYLKACDGLKSSDEGRAVLNGIQSVLDGTLPNFVLEYPCHSPSEKRWFLMSVAPLLGERGGAVVTHSDITERKQAEEALRVVSAELRQTLHTAATGLIHCSRDLRYLSANPAYAEWIGRPLEQIVGRPMVEVVGPAAFDIIRPRIERVLRGERVEYEDEVPIAGGLKWIHVVCTPDRDASGNVIGWVASVMDITERKRMEEERAQEARRKDEFLSLLGHELRNPLAAISTALQVLSGAVSGEMRASLNETIDRQLLLMRRLLDDLLDLGRITRGHIELKKERIDLAKFLQEVSVDAQQTAAKRRQKLILRLPTEAVTFNADELRLEQIAINLLSNASKYTLQGGRIEFSGNREGSEIVLRCKDNGRGILPEMQERIFEPFKRVGPLTDSHGEASLGIGLALVKRLVELHQGTVYVESSGPGMGSEFTVRLPIESASSGPRVASEARPVPTSRCARSIVVVEDNPDVSKTMVAALNQAGHEVSSFADASSALAGLSSLKPHAVLIDIGLPGIDGCELARMLRRRRHLQDALFVGLSGFKRPESGDDFDDFFTKPVDLPALLTLLDKPAPTGAMEVATEHRTLVKPKPLRVLLIEDHAGLSAAMAELLRSEGFEVRAALSGTEGLEAAPDFEPELTLCDLNLPDIGGMEVIRRLRSNPVTRNTYAVILTGLSNWEIRAFNDEAKTLGIDEFIGKPITSEVISTLIATLERQRRL